MQKMPFNLSIFQKILLAMLLATLIPLGGLWYINSYQSRQDWMTHIHQNLIKTTDSLTQRVDDWAQMHITMLNQNAALPTMMSMSVNEQKPILQTIAKTYQEIFLVHTIGLDGHNVSRNDDETPKFYGDRQYFQQVINGQPTGQQVIISRTVQKPALALAAPIRDPSQQIMGVLGIAILLQDISKAVTDVKIGATGFAILLDETGKVIAHGRPERIKTTLQDLGDHPVLKAAPASRTAPLLYEEEGRPVLAYAKKAQLGWTLIVQQDQQEALASLYLAQRNIFILFAVTFVLTILFAYGLARIIAHPIRLFTAMAEAISRGEEVGEIQETERGDEIGALARAIERMNYSLHIAAKKLQGSD